MGRFSAAKIAEILGPPHFSFGISRSQHKHYASKGLHTGMHNKGAWRGDLA